MTSTSDKHPATPRLRFSLAPEPSRLLRARERIRDYLTAHCADPTTVNDIVLAVEEACTNAIRHSGSGEDIDVQLRFSGDELRVSIKDEGRGFDVESFDSHKRPDPLLDHGRGLYLISRLCDELRLRRDGGLEVDMVKRAARSSAGAPAFEGTAVIGQRHLAGERLRTMLDEIDEGFDAFDWEYRYVHVNAVSLRRLGKSLDELLGRTPWEVFPALEGSELARRYREAMELGRPSVLEHRSVVDGQWLEVRIYPTSSGISCYYRGIDERKRKEVEREALLAERERATLEVELAKTVQRERQRLYDVLETLPAMVCLLTPDCRVAFANRSFREQFGEPHGRHCYEQCFGEAAPCSFCESFRPLETGEPHHWQVTTPAGTVVAAHDYPFSDVDGSPLVLEMDLDITEATHNEAALRELMATLEKRVAEAVAELQTSEEGARSLADIVEHAEMPIGVGAPDGSLVFFNQAFADLTGYSREELEEKALTGAVDLTPARWRATEAALLAEAVAQRRPVRYEKEYLRKDGSRVPIEVFAQPIFGKAGELLKYHSFITDISERKRAEEALQASEERFRSLFESTAEGIALHEIIYDEGGRAVDYRILDVNPAFESQTGLAARDARGRLASEFYGTGEAPYLSEYARVAEGGLPSRFETYFAPMERHFRITVTSPGHGRFATVFEDVTERTRAEEERKRMFERLSRSIERETRAARSAETLAKINEILLTALTPDDVIARLVGEASQAAGAEKALVIRVGEQGSYTITHVRNVRDELVGKAKDATFYPGFALAAEKRRPILIADNWADERLNQDFVVPYGLHAFQLLPLIVDDKVTHVLALSYDGPQAFDDEDCRAAERMAEAMSAALRNAVLFEAEQEARRQAAQQLESAQVLLDVSAVIADSTALQPMLEGLADALLRATAHTRVTVGLWDKERKSMTTVVSKGAHPIPLSTLSISEMSAPARRMVKTKKRVLIDYTRTRDERLRRLAERRHLRYGLAVPVLARSGLVASITVDAPGERQAFSEREIDLVQAVADQAALAIENARLTEGLRKSEEGARFLADVVEKADVPFAVREPGGRLVLFNQAFVELVGYSRRELEEGASTLAVGLTPPDWWEVEEPLLAEAVAARRPVRYEKEYLRKDGSRVPVEVFAQPVFDGAGEFAQYHSFITDISERKRAEEALQASEAKYRTLFDNMAEEVHFWRLVRDQAGEIVTWRLVSVNAPALRTWGFDSLAEIEGKTTEEIFGPGATEHYMPIVQQIVREGVAASYEDYFPNLDKHFRFTSVPLGEYFITTGADITAVKKSAQAALEAEKRFRATFEQAAVGIGHHASDGRWLRVNDRLCEMLGYQREELLGRTLADVTHPDDLAADLAHIDDLLAGNATGHTIETRYLRRDGQVVWGALTASLVRDEAGEPDYFVAVIQDISARKQAEEERQLLLEQSQAQAEELQAQGEELQVQSEELQAQTEELRLRSEDLAERARLAEALNAVNRLVNSTLDSNEIMQRALDHGVETLAADAGTIELHDRTRWVVRYQRGFTEADVGRRLTDAEAPNATRACVGMEPFAIADLRSDPAVNVGFVRDHALRSVLAIPLMAQGAVTGCLLFYGKTPRTFDEAETDFAGKLGAMVSLALENARQREELERAAALRYARSLIEASLDPFVTISAEGKITDVNEATERVTGCARAELIGSDFSDYFAEPEQARAGYRRVFAEGFVVDYPLAIRHRDGSVRDVLYNASLYRNEAGEVAGIFAAARDITERKRAEHEALENARRFEEQKRIAVTLQENLIHPLPSVDGLELGVVSQTAFEPELVGGDFSDVFVVDDAHVVVLIGDVAGKGVRAAGLTETVRSTIRALASVDCTPGFILAKANELLLRFDPDEAHVTALCAVLDPRTGHLTYASAGHPAPVHLGASSCRSLDVVFGPPLGTFRRPYANAHAMLTLEDYLVLYTDGVAEARRGDELLGEQRLLDVVERLRGGSAQEVAEGVRDGALVWADQLRDDLQVVVLRLA